MQNNYLGLFNISVTVSWDWTSFNVTRVEKNTLVDYAHAQVQGILILTPFFWKFTD